MAHGPADTAEFATRGTMWDMTEVGGFERASFDPANDVAVDPEFPAAGEWPSAVYAFDRDGRVQSEFVSRWGAPRVLGVRPASSPEWVGMFAAGGLGGVSGVYATPSARRVCVLVDGEAYVVCVDAPAEGAVVAHDTVEQVVPVAEPPLLLLVRGIDIVALGPEGVAWRSRRLAVDDLRVVSVDDSGIRCTGDMLSGEPVDVVVDPATGEVTAGPRLDGPPWNTPTSPTRP
jgi:hypothetical protein